jgi:hypothetical protein
MALQQCWDDWSMKKSIAPHVPVEDKSEHHDGIFSRTDSSLTLKTIAMFALLASSCNRLSAANRKIHFAIEQALRLPGLPA